jgi:hypothetical protein
MGKVVLLGGGFASGNTCAVAFWSRKNTLKNYYRIFFFLSSSASPKIMKKMPENVQRRPVRPRTAKMTVFGENRGS